MAANRDATVSITKAMGILLMVFCHAGCCYGFGLLHQCIYAFHMPLFVLMAGYCFKQEYCDRRLDFAKRRFKGLYLTFAKWTLIFLLMHNAACALLQGSAWAGVLKPEPWLGTIKEAFLLYPSSPLLGAYWFVRELFLASILFIVCIKGIRLHPWAWALGIETLAVATFALGIDSSVTHPYLTLTCTAYYCVGYAVTRERGGMPAWNSRWWVTVVLATAVVLESTQWPGAMNGPRSAAFMPLYFVCAVAGTLVTFNCSLAIGRHGAKWLSQGLCYIGDHTLSILTGHLLVMKLINVGLTLLMRLPAERINDYPYIKDLMWARPIYFISGVGVPLLLQWLWQRTKRQLKNWQR